MRPYGTAAAAIFCYNRAMRAACVGLTAVLLLATAGKVTARPPSANVILTEAQAQATAQRKDIFLIFGASWCPMCQDLEAYLREPQVAPIISRYFVIARLTTGEEYGGGNPRRNNPGAAELIPTFGGVPGSVPFFAFLDAKGHLIVNSCRPVKQEAGGGNIGFPVAPYEIAWFMTMLKRAAPSLTPQEAQTIETSLREAGRGISSSAP